MAAKKRGLGRGLDALLGGGDDSASRTEPQPGERLQQIPIEALQPGRYQPRRNIDPQRLAELTDSIRTQGVIQPLVVRAVANGRFEIVAGERRWRAAQQAALREVPAVVREIDDQAALAMALIENIQREDLNPLEEAQALERLIDEFELTHQAAADAVGRSRASVSNLLRLLELPEAIRTMLDRGELEMGHARALLGLPQAQALAVAREAAAGGWSVREVERRVQALGKAPAKTGSGGKAPTKDADIATLERELGETLNARVAIQHGRGGGGKLVVSYHSLDELEGILERIRR